jgi:hypothetical protein
MRRRASSCRYASNREFGALESPLERQNRCSAFESLNLRLFADAEHQGLTWLEVEANDVADFSTK